MHDPQVYGWEVAELDESCTVNDDAVIDVAQLVAEPFDFSSTIPLVDDDFDDLEIVEHYARYVDAA